jgi:hypothetical protein
MTLARIVEKTYQTERGCWEWQGERNEKGYGRVVIGGRKYYVHRVVASMASGRALGMDEVARHICDNPPCCNPHHLVPGTVRQNVQDAIDRGLYDRRQPRGRLTEAEVLHIKLCLAQGQSACSIAARLGKPETTIRNIRNGATWSWLPLPAKEEADPFA